MATEITGVKLVATSDTRGLEDGVTRVGGAFTELNSKVQLAKEAFNIAQQGFDAFVSIINRGQAFNDLSNAFGNLQKQAGGLATNELQALRTATQGLISDTDLMRASNEALLGGLKPDQFRQLAEAADALDDAVGGGGATASLNALVTATNTGNERLLKQYGIVIDNAEAERKFAESIGKTASQLNEAGKREAARIAILEKVKEQTKLLGDGTDTAGDAMERLSATLANNIDHLTQGVVKNQELTQALSALGQTAKLLPVDIVDRFAFALGTLASVPVNVLNEIAAAVSGISQAFGGSALGSIDSLSVKLADLRKRRDELQKRFDTANNPGGILDALLGEDPAIIHRELDRVDSEIEALAATVSSEYIPTAVKAEIQSGKLEKSFIDVGKAAKEDGKKGLAEFKGTLDTIVELFDTQFDQDGMLFKLWGSKDNTEEFDKFRQRWTETVDFFGDVFTPMLEGQAANFEDIFKDAAKRIAIGFAAELATHTALAAGINVSGVGGAQGFGASLAASLGFGGPDTKGLGDIFGGAGAAAGSANIGFGASASAYIPQIVAAVGAYFVASKTLSGVESVAGGGKLSTAEQFALALPTFGLSFAYNDVHDFFGGDSDLAHERMKREGAFDEIFKDKGSSFAGVNGNIDLSPENFNTSGKFGGKGTALVNPFAQILSGGDDKLGSDLAGIFETGVTEGENFNEVIVNTLSLMDKLGFNADDAKNQLSELFLDGKIGLDEFAAGVDNLNLLAQEDLLGDNSIVDAFNIMGKNLGEEGSPRVALKGLELAFKEMAQQGIDSPSEILEYVTQHFGPQAAAVFQRLGEIGVDSFEDIGTLGPDQLAQVFGALKDLEGGFGDVKSASDDVGNSDGIQKQADHAKNLQTRLEKATSAARDLKKAIDSLPKDGSDIGGSDPNQQLNKKPA